MTPTEQRAVKQACAWVGWRYLDGSIYENDAPQSIRLRSLADLAEAVRVKFIDTEHSMKSDLNGASVWSAKARSAFQFWGTQGPLILSCSGRRQEVDSRGNARPSRF